jgi:hypothetical protein
MIQNNIHIANNGFLNASTAEDHWFCDGERIGLVNLFSEVNDFRKGFDQRTLALETGCA